jgi:hypothetical protein
VVFAFGGDIVNVFWGTSGNQKKMYRIFSPKGNMQLGIFPEGIFAL